MHAVSLLVVLLTAKALTLLKWGAPVSFWTPIAEIWQDVLVALVFAVIERVMRNAHAAWVLYAASVVYVAINVPVTLVLSSPLTPMMMRATGGPLLDSITHYLNFTNIGATLLVITIGIMLPVVFRHVTVQPSLAIGGLAVVLAGPYADEKVDTHGLHRNAFAALWPARLRDFATKPESPFDWRGSPFPGVPSESLVRYRAGAAGKNVVVVILESTGAQYLKPYGAADNPMPRLTELASRSVVFENAYAVYPESIKGLFATLCSTYPSLNTAAETVAQFPCSSLATAYARAGYRTALFHSGRFAYLGMRAVVDNRGFGTLEDAGDISGEVRSSFGIDEGSTVRRMLSWIDSVPAGQKFFLMYLPVAGHHPYATPQPGPFDGDTEISNYRNALHYADASLGELLDGIRDRHLETNTMLMIFGDHGEAFGQHDGNFGHTLFIYDENVQVPLIVALPGVVDGQIRVRRVASLIDIGPTLLDLSGIPIPETIDGNSLLLPEPRMALFFTDYSLSLLGLRDSCWKYIFEMDSSRSKLFDVCKDPAESANRYEVETARANAYRDRVNIWIRSN